MGFSSVGNILNKKIKQKPGLSRQIQASLVCEEFDKIIDNKWGDKVKNKAKAMYFKDNVLTIACLSSVMAQEIKLYENEIINTLNQKFNGQIDRFRYLV